MRKAENYPAPGQSSKVDGVSIRISGDQEVAEGLLRHGVTVNARLLLALKEAGQMLADAAGRNVAPRRYNVKGRSGGNLARSFVVKDRKGWLKYGLLGVAVRSRARYHHYQEFGVERPNTQVLLYRTDEGRKVRRGQGIDARHGRFAIGTNRLNPGVRVRSYRRDISIPAQTMLGRAVATMRPIVFSRLQDEINSLNSTVLR